MNDDVTDLEKRLLNLVRQATVTGVDTEAARVKVAFMNNTSGWVPWIMPRSGGVRHWSAPQMGEDVLLLSPEGDTESAIALPSLYKAEFPPPDTNPHEHSLHYEDGAIIGYNDETHHLQATLPEGATTDLVSDGGITLTGDLTVNGNVTHNGDTIVNGTTHSSGNISTDASMTATANVSAANVSASGNISDGTGSLSDNRAVFNSHTHPGDSGGTTGTPNQQQ